MRVLLAALCCVGYAHLQLRQSVPGGLLDASTESRLQTLQGQYVYHDPRLGPVLAGPVSPVAVANTDTRSERVFPLQSRVHTTSPANAESLVWSPEGLLLSFNQNTALDAPTTANNTADAVPTNGPLPTCPAKPSTTPEQELAQLANAGLVKCYDKNATSIPFTESDNPNEYLSRGGDATAHTYGEVSMEGMRQILHEAVRISLNLPETASADEISQHFHEYDFYDLGSGFGKFPMFASFLGFNQVVGVELDKHRAEFAAKRHDIVQQNFPCYSEKMTFLQGSFLSEHVTWAKGKAKRIIFMDSVCWGSFWKELVTMFDYAEFGEDTVIASIGQTKMDDRFNSEGTKFVKVSWMQSCGVHYFRKKPNVPPLPPKGPAWRKLHRK